MRRSGVFISHALYSLTPCAGAKKRAPETTDSRSTQSVGSGSRARETLTGKSRIITPCAAEIPNAQLGLDGPPNPAPNPQPPPPTPRALNFRAPKYSSPIWPVAAPVIYRDVCYRQFRRPCRRRIAYTPNPNYSRRPAGLVRAHVAADSPMRMA